MIRQGLIFFKNELRLNLRTKESFISMVFFSLLVILVFHFGFALDKETTASLAGPMIWVATLFGGMLRMNRTFEMENEGSLFDSLRLIKGAAVPFFLSKFLINFIFILVLEILIFGFVIFLFNIAGPGEYLRLFWLPFLLGGFGLACIGTTFSGMVVSHGKKDLILPIIAYPILVPVIIGVMKSVEYSVLGIPLEINYTWIKVLVAFNVIYFILSLIVYESILEA